MDLRAPWRRNRHERTGFLLYGQAVAAAREPYLYTALGVPDTLHGRFDLIGLHAFLLIRRLRPLPPPGPDLAQAVFDAMFSDMDVSLREMGVGDLSVGKRVRTMWEAFHGRAHAYDAAMDADDLSLLQQALIRNVWRGAAAPGHPTNEFVGTPPGHPTNEFVGTPPGASGLARLAFAQARHLATQELRSFVAGRADFLPAAEALR